MANDTQNRYDELPYGSYPIKGTSPEHLSTMATLMGLKASPADRCRVLEIGCSSGGNLLPLALYWPNSEFMGIDLSEVQIDQGKRDVEALSVANLQLRRADILEIDESYGKFDYIICHGVYSWVPPAVQRGILKVCRENLEPNGVAYVSYNTFPGWHENQAIREMMLYHVEGIEGPQRQVRQARTLINWLADTVPEKYAYGRFLRECRDELHRRRNAYIFHEYLEDVNAPEFFFQFMQKAMAQGLSYLGETAPKDLVGQGFLKDAEETLIRNTHDPIRREQYLDFLRNRKFRRTLLCQHEVNQKRRFDLDGMGGLYVAPAAKPVEDAQGGDNREATFTFRTGVELSTPEPIFAAALRELADTWPNSMLLSDLYDRTARRLALKDTARNQQILCGRIVRHFQSELLEVSTQPRRAAGAVSEKPISFELARYQASTTKILSNLQHDVVYAGELSEIGYRSLPFLDGTRNKATIAALLSDSSEATDPAATVSLDQVEAGLQDLADHSLLLNG